MSRYLDSNGTLYLWQKIKLVLTGKVDKVDGKGLSANDYTNTEKGKVAASIKNLAVASGGGVTFTNNNDEDSTIQPYADATSTVHGLMSTADKAKLDAFGAASIYALKTDLASLYRYVGSVATLDDLPASGNTVGDVYNIEESGMNYGWTGEEWDALGEIFTIDSITNAEIDTIVAS